MTAVALRAILMMPLAVPIREAYSGEDVGDLFKAGPCPERNDIAPGKSDTTRDDSGAWNDMVADMERPAPGRDGGAEEAASRTCPFVGGQAVMEGILMRNGGRYAVAVRRRDGSIVAERRGWLGMTRRGPLSRPFLRGFPLLVETLINGIRALNRSAELTGECGRAGNGPSRVQLLFTLLAAFGLAALMFVVAPHLLSLGMQRLDLGGDMEGFTFHMWDGLFKFLIFIGCIAAVSFVPANLSLRGVPCGTAVCMPGAAPRSCWSFFPLPFWRMLRPYRLCSRCGGRKMRCCATRACCCSRFC